MKATIALLITSFDDEDGFRRCKREMESYRSEVEDFLDCLRHDIEDLKEKAEQATREYNGAVESFNHRARN